MCNQCILTTNYILITDFRITNTCKICRKLASSQFHGIKQMILIQIFITFGKGFRENRYFLKESLLLTFFDISRRVIRIFGYLIPTFRHIKHRSFNTKQVFGSSARSIDSHCSRSCNNSSCSIFCCLLCHCFH